MKELIINKNDAGQRLDKFLTKTLKNLPFSLLYKSIRTKKIKVNRKRAEINQVLFEGDTLQLFLSPEFFQDETHTTTSSLSNIHPNLNILYEDENILLLNKGAGVSVHEGDENDGTTLITSIQAYLYQKGEYDPNYEQSFAPSLCNRIDRNTCGIVIAAKNAEALRIMDEKIRNRELEKKYLCVVHGLPQPKEQLLTGYLIKNEKENMVRVFDSHPPKGAKEIKTKYKLLQTKNNLSLLEVELLTGRTHQIRAHLAHAGYPLLGEGKYAQNKEDKKIGYSYQALCSYSLTFKFEGEGTNLDYLNGKTFRIPKDQIYFIKELFMKD